MSGISSWILSIAGVICISVIVEIIMPEGQMNKYIKGVLSFIIIFVIVSPLPNLLKQKDISITTNINQIGVQQDFLDKYNLACKDAIEKDLIQQLDEMGYGGISIGLSYCTDGETCRFDKAYVELKGLVIKENSAHKNISEIKEEIAEVIHKKLCDVEVCYEE